jgi:hypothetical protein
MADFRMEDLVVANAVLCTGITGFTYNYFPPEPSPNWQWLAVPANYIFAKWTPSGWVILYVGECENCKTRFANHERWNEAVTDYGATHALTHQSSALEADRKREEIDLIAAYNPPMNIQHRTSELAGLGAWPSPLFGLSQAGLGRKR